MNQVKRKFDKEFKVEAVKMVTDGGLSKTEVGRRLGISSDLVGKWVKALQVDGNGAFPGKGRLTPIEEENRKLRQEVRELRMETEFLKKSAAYFASLKK